MVTWILLVVIQTVTFAVPIDTEDACDALAQLTVAHWRATKQEGAQALCAKTIEV